MKGNSPSPPARHLQHGRLAEDLACQHLVEQGLETVSRNFRSRHGEIDLVMQDADRLVFVEVRYRASRRYGNAAETIRPDKITRLRHTAQFFLQQYRQYGNLGSRFDVVAIHGPLHAPEMNWIKDAF